MDIRLITYVKTMEQNAEQTPKKSEYGAENITILAGRDAVRTRPSMYIGDTTLRGLHHLIYEAVDNSIDEALAGYCTRVIVIIHPDGSVSVEDNGRGIPVEPHPKLKISALTVVMTELHAGGKFDNNTYKVSGGLHGVGISVANFLSIRFEVWVKRNGKLYYQKYDAGRPVTGVEEIGTSTETGTKVQILPDPAIFPEATFNFDTLATRLRELAFLNKGIEITITDERTPGNERKIEVFKYAGGVSEFVQHLNKGKQTLHPVIYFTKKKDAVELEIAMQYTTAYQENTHSFANNINTHEGGTHMSGFKSALTRVINTYIRSSDRKPNKPVKQNKQKEIEDFSGEDVREGLTAIISVKLPNPQFEGQTKTKLGNAEIAGIVTSLVVEGLSTYLQEHPADARMIVAKCEEAMRAREAARKAKELARKGVFEGGSLPGKLADCSNKDPAKCEVFICEGDSAGGCFSGDTKIACADGRNISFNELIEEHNQGKENYCYTIMDDGSIGIQKITNPRKTKSNTQVIKIILDNNEEIVCTPDHLFMLRNKIYKHAAELKKDDSLMPLNKKVSKIGGRITIDGYEMVYDPVHKWKFTHMLADDYNLRNNIYGLTDGSHRHHKDFNKLNNNPSNICRLTKEEHMTLHKNLIYKLHSREDVKEKLRVIRQSPEFRENIRKKISVMKEELSKRAKAQWENEEYKKFMVQKFLNYYNSNESYRKKSQEILSEAQQKYWASNENRRIQSEKTRKFFEAHPEAKKMLSEVAKKQWNSELRAWRSSKTKEQWTPEFRMKRKETYNKACYESTIKVLRAIYDKKKEIDIQEFEDQRRSENNRSILSYKTFFGRFFNNDENKLKEAVKNYNHKVKSIEWLDETMDVYDIEVPGTHNFALASGIFVHNSAKQGRNREFQAVLPLRGKILNVEKARLHKIFENIEIRAMITAIGTGIKEEFNLGNARYHKIILATDADVDGSHIRTLLLTFFYRYMKPLIEAGYIYIAQPPLYKIKIGKTISYAYNDREKEQALVGKENAAIQRYKGLGEMNPEQLWETTMDPTVRILKQVVIEDAVESDRIFALLMGEEVQPRRAFIMKHGKDVVNLDV